MMFKKPEQRKKLQENTDWGELHEALDSAMFRIREAMDDIKGYCETQDQFSQLSDLHDELYAIYEETEANINAEYADMVREMTREYYRSVI